MNPSHISYGSASARPRPQKVSLRKTNILRAEHGPQASTPPSTATSVQWAISLTARVDRDTPDALVWTAAARNFLVRRPRLVSALRPPTPVALDVALTRGFD